MLYQKGNEIVTDTLDVRFAKFGKDGQDLEITTPDGKLYLHAGEVKSLMKLFASDELTVIQRGAKPKVEDSWRGSVDRQGGAVDQTDLDRYNR